ncbi:MAG: circadian clock protein KaiC [Planctomycetes bacterium]|nr:circadian clock protein KaiC [Planctomycetota bacterium]
MAKRVRRGKLEPLEKCPTGISGLDEITEGGLPRGRPTLVCGSAGSGKTLLGMEFLIRGITSFNEPGVFMAFEESAQELAENVASLGFDVPGLIARKKLLIDHVRIERSEIEETGEYDLEGLFVRLGAAVDEVGAKRVVLDTVEALFGGLPNEAILRAELRRLFRWLKTRGLTAVITGETGERTLTRYGIEEYISDCVIFLDHRVNNQIATRRLRVVKYRGSKHGTNEYPTLIDEDGLSVLPITSLGLSYPVSRDRVSTGVPRLDAMLGGKGYYRGSTVLLSGSAGTGKSSLAATFADSICRSGKRIIYLSFEESADQIIRNMQSIGVNLKQWREKGNLVFNTVRPTLQGLEMHLAMIRKMVKAFKPHAIVMDPISNLISVSDRIDTKAMLMRLIDFLKNQGITAVFTSLTTGGLELEQTEEGVSSLMDTWLLVKMVERNGERNRLLYVLKSRGMSHSNQVREFRLTDDGIVLTDVYLGGGEVLTGSARMLQEMQDRVQTEVAAADAARRKRELDIEKADLRADLDALKARLANIEAEQNLAQRGETTRIETLGQRRRSLSRSRQAD